MKPKIIFIHGMFLNPRSWEAWQSFFTDRGWTNEAPAWPFHQGEPAALRDDPPAELGDLTLSEVCVHFRDVLAREAEPPVLIGHSMGGLVVQKLVAEGRARAGVCVASVAPNRMMALDWSFMKNVAAITNPLAGHRHYTMTAQLFYDNFANTLSERESSIAWERYAMPESRQVLRDALGAEGEIDVEREHAPLLFIGAEEDRIIPDSLVRRNAHAWTDARSHSEYRPFSGRGHFLCTQPGWEEVAGTVANWLEGHVTAVRS